MTSSEIYTLIQDLKEACRRPLFTEICLELADININNAPCNTPVTVGANKDVNQVHGGIEKEQEQKIVPDGQSSSRDALSETDSQGGLLWPPSMTAVKNNGKTWRELLNDASKLLPAMTEKEHGEISHLASVLLLGFLLPFSTGNEYFLLQYAPESQRSDFTKSNTNDNVNTTLDYILNMDLEERLESTCRHYSANEFGDHEVLTDASWELAFDTFLRDGLAPFLGGRPAHLQQVDLLHILAMIIHPQPSENVIPDTAHFLGNKCFWQSACKLMKNRDAHSFHVNYGHRLKIIQLIISDLVIPPFDADSPISNISLFDGALPHLRASLHSFAVDALTMEDVHWARSAAITIAVQSHMEVVWKEEWEFLINKMVDDRTLYPGCKCCPHMLKKRRIFKQSNWAGDDSSFCPHAARGLHLAEFLLRTCQSRFSDVGKDFLNEAFSSLTDAIEWQMHCWKKNEDSDAEATESEEPPCMLASLLFAAKHFFYFLIPLEERTTSNAEDSNDSNSDIMIRRDEIIACSLELIQHPDDGIASEAAELVALACAYGSKTFIDRYAKGLFKSMELVIPDVCGPESNRSLDHFLVPSIQAAASAASRVSPAFALSFLNFLLELLAKEIAKINQKKAFKETMDASADSEQKRFLLRLLSSVSISNPVIAAEKTEVFIALLDKTAEKSSQSQVIAALFACRQARLFEQQEDAGEAAALVATKQMDDRWSLYQLARMSLRTGNFGVAVQCYQKILASPLSERYFLWVSALAKVAQSEFYLSLYAAKGIPHASIMLRSALSLLQSLKALYRSPKSDFSLQITLVNLRLDFIDLLTGLRQLMKEMRLTGTGPARRTRSFLHFQSVVRCFDALACRYWSVYRLYGLFSCQQSRTCLRTLHSVSRFVAHSVRVVFSDMHLSQKKEENWPGGQSSGDLTLPVSRFMQRLDDRLLQKMSPSIDTVIRAAAMVEVLDGVLLCPVPFPVGFLAVSSPPNGQLTLSADPELLCIGDAEDQRDDFASIEAYPGISFAFCATGEISAAFLAEAKLHFTTIVLWHRAGYIGPIQEDEHLTDEKQDDEHMVDEKQEEESLLTASKIIPRPWKYQAVSTNLLMNGKFNVKIECPPIREEGVYLIDVKLGCRDFRGGEWEVPIDESSRTIQVEVSRSRWHG